MQVLLLAFENILPGNINTAIDQGHELKDHRKCTTKMASQRLTDQWRCVSLNFGTMLGLCVVASFHIADLHLTSLF